MIWNVSTAGRRKIFKDLLKFQVLLYIFYCMSFGSTIYLLPAPFNVGNVISIYSKKIKYINSKQHKQLVESIHIS